MPVSVAEGIRKGPVTQAAQEVTVLGQVTNIHRFGALLDKLKDILQQLWVADTHSLFHVEETRQTGLEDQIDIPQLALEPDRGVA